MKGKAMNETAKMGGQEVRGLLQARPRFKPTPNHVGEKFTSLARWNSSTPVNGKKDVIYKKEKS